VSGSLRDRAKRTRPDVCVQAFARGFERASIGSGSRLSRSQERQQQSISGT
jgi:hypothetical protein